MFFLFAPSPTFKQKTCQYVLLRLFDVYSTLYVHCCSFGNKNCSKMNILNKEALGIPHTKILAY